MFHPIIILSVTFTFIILLLRFRVPLYLAMFLGSICLGILYRISWLDQLITIKKSLLSPVFIQLGVALCLISFLENVLRTRGYLDKTLNSIKILVPNVKLNMIFMPSFLGLLPSPGGAYFSAPLLAEAGKDLTMSPEDKSMVNYWYRHVWEFFIPLYPAIILSSQILTVPIGKISFITFWFFFICLIIGYFFVLRRIKPGENRQVSVDLSHGKRKALIDLLSGVWPILGIVLTVLLFRFDVGLTVLAFMIIIIIIKKYRFADIKKLFKESFQITIIFLIAGILIFKQMLDTAGVVAWLPVFLHSLGIPNLLVVVFLTFFIGFATGMSQAYVAAAFPLLTGVFGTGTAIIPGMLALAVMSGFIGVMLSPVHLCLILTVQYFKADVVKVFKRLIIPEAILLLCAVLFAVFWK